MAGGNLTLGSAGGHLSTMFAAFCHALVSPPPPLKPVSISVLETVGTGHGEKQTLILEDRWLLYHRMASIIRL